MDTLCTSLVICRNGGLQKGSDNKLTKKAVCVGTGVSEVTIRKIYKLMYPRILELFPSDFNVVFEKLPSS